MFWGLYLLFASSLQKAELCVGLGIAVLAATGTEVVYAQNLAFFKPKLYWLALSLELPWYVLSGAWVIFLVLAKFALRIDNPKSLHRAVRFDAGRGDSESHARRALAITYSTVPPTSIIVDILRDADLMLFHQISPSGVPKITQELGAEP